MSNQAVDVEILGKTTRVNCPSGQEASLIRAAQDLDQRLKDMAERTKVTNEVKLLTIAALNICYELQTERQKQNEQQQQISERVEELTASLQAVLNKVPHG
ncbi:cell division protein ZapA [Vibrio metschnikovii]|jgi:cell division protein ZapA|uniref:Cell division protein ZapA n=7 Tax=Bacteria TaxID=2 RepID=A0A9X0RB18_VIBME|nr:MULTISPECIES: cell division protein ZapA [Vibrio]EKO3557368.1 cell division protein ZapA [Vibrio metschnikovii]EKO3565988.1 cell division protein ZapA [Vibrio metschnikovii]EKO3568658.1 cell division protein ZapA [Vibrio metschnikovii]EKO3572263.1 cell division protein ZapA [Vibrio metschnikovii]EKO3575809.1 cell division protein ZapA [Vibrio metschnikovii]